MLWPSVLMGLYHTHSPKQETSEEMRRGEERGRRDGPAVRVLAAPAEGLSLVRFVVFIFNFASLKSCVLFVCF